MKLKPISILVVVLTLGCGTSDDSADSENEKKGAELNEAAEVPVDISQFPPNGFDGNENLAKSNANKFYIIATKHMDLNSGRFINPDSAVVNAARSNFYYESCAATTLLGQAYVQKGKLQKGVEYYNRAIELDSTQGQPYFHRGTAFYIMGNIPIACESWKKAGNLGVVNAQKALSMYCN